MIDIKDRVCEAVAGKIMSAEAAAEFVKDGDNVGTSGFTPSGYPKGRKRQKNSFPNQRLDRCFCRS